ncbi:MAG: chorismate mutase [Clostridiaceae bacterium]|nr:chorismate mutase [Clostridiaceae bacterium]
MNQLEKARKDINEIDDRMRELFARRLEASARVLEYKRGCGMPIFDPEREAQVIANGLGRIDNPLFAGYYKRFITCLMDISKDYQAAILKEDKNI